jgi:hypothetical protein
MLPEPDVGISVGRLLLGDGDAPPVQAAAMSVTIANAPGTRSERLGTFWASSFSSGRSRLVPFRVGRELEAMLSLPHQADSLALLCQRLGRGRGEILLRDHQL